MNEAEKKNLIAQWAFDTRPLLLRFHLWLEDVEVEWEKGGGGKGKGKGPKPVRDNYTFMAHEMRRCMAMTCGITSLGTKLFGRFGEGKDKEKHEINQVKKDADAISAYIMSEGLWHFTRNLPENHAVMVCLGEGLMPKAGETPEMGANPQLGFGRVYARPEVAKFIDSRIHRLFNDPDYTWEIFYQKIKEKGITIWGMAVDTLENTSRFAKGDATGPMAVAHIFDQPLVLTLPYEAYMGTLLIPDVVKQTALENSIHIDLLSDRAKLVEAIELTLPDIKRENIHVWTLSGKSRESRLGELWKKWRALGVDLVDDNWQCVNGLSAFTESGTYAPAYMVKTWRENNESHIFLIDGYAASAEAMQAASLSQALELDVSMALHTPNFNYTLEVDPQIMQLDAKSENFTQELRELLGKDLSKADIAYYKDAIDEAWAANMPMGNRVIRTEDFFPEKKWDVLAATGYMCDDPYTNSKGVEDLGDNRYRVTTRLTTNKVTVKTTFVFRLKESFEECRLSFNPLLERFAYGEDYKSRPVRISDSGRIRNELQTLVSQALEFKGEKIIVYFDKISSDILSLEKQKKIREVLNWYKESHPSWFAWLEIR